MIKKLQKKYALSEQGAKRPDQRMPGLCPSESVFYVPGRTFILPGQRSDERGCSRWENSILCGRLRGVYRPDFADHFLSI